MNGFFGTGTMGTAPWEDLKRQILSSKQKSLTNRQPDLVIRAIDCCMADLIEELSQLSSEFASEGQLTANSIVMFGHSIQVETSPSQMVSQSQDRVTVIPKLENASGD